MFRAIRELLRFAFPVMVGQVGLMLIGAGDVYIATQHSTTALAAIGLAVAFANPVLIVGLAFQFALSPLIAKRRGEGAETDLLVGSTLAYALLLSLPFMAATYLAAELVPLLGYDAKITEMVSSYVRISVGSIPGVFIYTSLREWLQAHERTLWANAVSILGVPLNLVFNWALVFGRFGLPELGVDGLAWASLLIRWCMGLALLVPLATQLFRTRAVEWEFLGAVFRLGWPGAVAMFFEVMAFCSVTLFVGKFGEVQTAANNLVLTLASVTFMIPTAIASAVGVKVGHAFGEKSLRSLRRYAAAGLVMSLSFMGCSALSFGFFPQQILAVFGAAPEVIAVAIGLIYWVALFQVFDGAQVTLGAILRGLTISRPVSIVSFVGYWVFGIPLGWTLAYKFDYQAQGFWVGLALSLALVAIGLAVLTWRRILELAADGNDDSRAAVLKHATE